jgi:hypothetical protein
MIIWINYNDRTLRPSPGIMVSKRNHPKMAQHFRLVKYYNLPRYIHMCTYAHVYVYIYIHMYEQCEYVWLLVTFAGIYCNYIWMNDDDNGRMIIIYDIYIYMCIYDIWKRIYGDIFMACELYIYIHSQQWMRGVVSNMAAIKILMD